MKVLLISANTLKAPYPVYPMSLDYVAGLLIEKHQVQIADMNLLSLESLGDLIYEFVPDIIGVSLRNIDNTDTANPLGFLNDYKMLISEIRQRIRAAIILGGPGFSIMPEAFMSALGADFGIVGEGERLRELVDILENGGQPDALPGLVTPIGEFTPPPPLSIEPVRHFDPNHDHVGFYLQNGGMLNLQTKRGCPFRCVYCTYPHIEGRRFRFFKPESVAQTARELQEAGAKYLFIADSAFNADVSHSLAVAEEFRKAGITIPWGAFLAPMKMPAAYFESLAKAGLTHVEFGTESLSDRVLNAYGKPFNRKQVLQSHEAALNAGLYVAHYFLFGGPGETAQTLETTLSHIDKLVKSVLFLFCGMRIYPHTELFHRALAEGQITGSQSLLEPVFYKSPDIGDYNILERLRVWGGSRINRVIGAGDENTNRLVTRMYERGYSGPLWEYLIR